MRLATRFVAAVAVSPFGIPPCPGRQVGEGICPAQDAKPDLPEPSHVFKIVLTPFVATANLPLDKGAAAYSRSQTLGAGATAPLSGWPAWRRTPVEAGLTLSDVALLVHLNAVA